MDQVGLVQALEWFCDQQENATGITFEFTSNACSLDVPSQKAIQIYRIVQESCTNAIKHASASIISVGLSMLEDKIILQIKDDGIGMDVQEIEKNSNGLGQISMQERAKKLDANLRVSSKKNKGTTIELEMNHFYTTDKKEA